ncbi:MAG: glutaredoxin family protein [Gulosibacter sp.]|uniref:glutaredoxin family protein n=1 Tax=Gulosibacter sp. TaxID=2817531 RepID=UPI003F9069DA
MIGRIFRGSRDPHVVDFYEKPGCHLCEDALAIVTAEVERSGATLRRHNILEDRELQRQYGELIPVVLIDGEQHATWFVQQERLRKSLS